MAVGGVSSSNMSSLYGNRNVISGLASGMDTESMIENAVSGIKNKITSLTQKQTKIGWQQEAYRGIIDKMVKFTNKYASYTSSTNMLSSSFFNKAVLTTATGGNASKVSATGKTNSTITIDAITALATAAQQKVGGGFTGGSRVPSSANPGVMVPGFAADSAINLDDSKQVSAMSGVLTLTCGTNTVDLSFASDEVYGTAAELKAAIATKLENAKIYTTDGEKKASDLIDVSESGGVISFAPKGGTGNDVFISGAYGDLKDALGLPADNTSNTLTSITVDPSKLQKTVYTGDSISEQTMSFTLDGTTKKITLPKYVNGTTKPEDFVRDLQAELNKAFGTGKITVSDADGGAAATMKLQFEVKDGSTLMMDSMAGKALGFGGSKTTSYIDMSKSLGDLGIAMGADGEDFIINGVTVGKFTKDTTLETVMTAINSNADAGVNVTYSKTTSQFLFTAKKTGAANGINIEAGGLAEKMFGAMSESGTDAEFSMSVNGTPYTNVTRSDNTFEVDGLNITLNETFSTGDKVGFTSKTDTDTIVNAVKDMVKDFNAMAQEIKKAYGTMPLEKANKSKYEPLTDDDLADMSESAIEAYEEKAKTGLLFGDNDLSSLYGRMISAFTPSGADGGAMRSIGINTEYSADTGTTVTLDEDKLRAMLETSPDAVKDVFSKSKENGAGTNGIMVNLKTQLDNYARTTGATKGILIEKAGSPLSPATVLKNSLLTSSNNLEKEIERWQVKLSDKVDLYTRKFTQLEQLIAQSNNQSSSLMSLMGGG